MATKNWNPKKAVLAITGIGQVVGYATGTMIETARDEDSFTKEHGAQGDAVRIANANRGGKITFYLQNQSPTNDLLQALLTLDELTGLGVRSASIVDLNGTLVVSAQECWIMKPADVSLAGGEAGVREWVLDCSAINYKGGGALL